jgi:hypothetical protein
VSNSDRQQLLHTVDDRIALKINLIARAPTSLAVIPTPFKQRQTINNSTATRATSVAHLRRYIQLDIMRSCHEKPCEPLRR